MPQLLRRALRTFPFSWPAELVRRVRESIAERGSAADRGKQIGIHGNGLTATGVPAG